MNKKLVLYYSDRYASFLQAELTDKPEAAPETKFENKMAFDKHVFDINENTYKNILSELNYEQNYEEACGEKFKLEDDEMFTNLKEQKFEEVVKMLA